MSNQGQPSRPLQIDWTPIFLAMFAVMDIVGVFQLWAITKKPTLLPQTTKMRKKHSSKQTSGLASR